MVKVIKIKKEIIKINNIEKKGLSISQNKKPNISNLEQTHKILIFHKK